MGGGRGGSWVGGRVGGMGVDVNKELKTLEKSHKKKIGGGGREGGQVELYGGVGQDGCE